MSELTKQQSDQLTNILIGCAILCVVGAGIFFIPQWMEDSRVRRQAETLARGLSGKLEELPKGEHKDTLPEQDAWGRRFEAVFKVDEYYQSVIVTSSGRDLVHGSGDDISGKYSHMNLSEAVGDGIERGARRVGKGFTDGALESLKGDDAKGSGGFLSWFKRKKDKE